MCCDESVRDFNAVGLQFDSDSPCLTQVTRFLSWLAAPNNYLVVESVFFEVQLARTRSQSDSRMYGCGRSQPMRAPTADRNTTNPAVNHLFCSLCSDCHARHDLAFFLNAYSYFYVVYSHTKAQCLLSLQNWVRASVLQEVSFSIILKRLWIVVTPCSSRFPFWFSIFRSCATRHWESLPFKHRVSWTRWGTLLLPMPYSEQCMLLCVRHGTVNARGGNNWGYMFYPKSLMCWGS